MVRSAAHRLVKAIAMGWSDLVGQRPCNAWVWRRPSKPIVRMLEGSGEDK